MINMKILRLIIKINSNAATIELSDNFPKLEYKFINRNLINKKKQANKLE